MPQAADLPLNIAVLLIASAGASLIFQQRELAARLFGAGCVVAAASGIAANLACAHSVLAEIVLLLGTIGACAAILGARRWPFYLVVLAGALWIAAPTLELIAHLVLSFWWIIPLLVVAALISYLIVTISLRRLGERAHSARPKSMFTRFLGRLLDQLTGIPRRRRRRERHIGEFGNTKRSRSGPGPHTI